MAIVWQICSYKTLNKTEQIQKRCLAIILDDNVMSATAKLFRKEVVKKLRTLGTHIPKTIDDLNLNFMKIYLH